MKVLICGFLMTILSSTIKPFQARYLLVDINITHKAAKINPTFTPGSSSIIHKVRRTNYEGKKVRVPETKKDCENEMVNQNGYYIGRDKATTARFGLKFVAKLTWDDPETISVLKSNKGECNSLSTKVGYQKCGIGKSLLMLCLVDKDVIADGGLNPFTYNDNLIKAYTIWEDTEFRKRARELCKSIVEIACVTYSGTPNYACKSYIEAAKASKYEMMFVDRHPGNEYDVFKTIEAESQFNKGPDDFIDTYGQEWFFCKCKQGSTQDCLQLDEYSKHDVLDL